MAFSFITPLFNGADFIEATLASILSEAAAEDEILVVDDGSTDDGGRRAAAMSGRVQVLRQDNQGEAAAVDAGLAATRAALVAIVNADDPLRAGWRRAIHAAFENDPQLSAAYPDWVRIDDRGRELSRHQTAEYDYRIMVCAHLCIPGPGACFRRADLGGEPVRDAAAHGISDFDFWLRFGLRNRRIQRVAGWLADWRAHKAGATVALQGARMAQARVGVIERLFARPDLPEDVGAMREQAMSAAHYNAALAALRAKDVDGRAHLAQSFRWARTWPSFVPSAQRRSWPRMAYIAAQPAASLLHRLANPLLPLQYRHDRVVQQTFGVNPTLSSQ